MDNNVNPDNWSIEDFKSFVEHYDLVVGYEKPTAFGIGFAEVSKSDGKFLDTRFPFPNYKGNYGTAAILSYCLKYFSGTQTFVVSKDTLLSILRFFAAFEGDGKRHGNIEAIKMAYDQIFRSDVYVRRQAVVTFIGWNDSGPKTVSDAYLRLHLLSHRLVKPNEINLDGIFTLLPNNVWTDEGPISQEDFPERRHSALLKGKNLHVYGVDKFPAMLDYVVPSGVRIADASRLRLGAYVGEGTTVMHEGFINFNAGTLGTSMVEGRISAGVVVGDQTDVGGGASIMGTLSGGGKEKITIGRGCLIGANAGTGISLGDKCVIEAGLYVTAGMPVWYRDKCLKSSELSGMDGLTFRRHSSDGFVEVLDSPNKITLNDELHKND